jgi:hypothetical protein
MDERKQAQLKKLPGVDRILEYGTKDRQFDDIPKSVLIPAIRAAIEDMRDPDTQSKAPVDNGCFSRDTLVAQLKNGPPE